MDANQPTNIGIPTPGLGQVQHPSAIPGQAAGSLAGVAPELTVPAQPVPSAEDDTAALDQEWVNKAKSIVDQTKDDPFAQSKGLHKVKAGYLKARFNKDLKVDEDST